MLHDIRPRESAEYLADDGMIMIVGQEKKNQETYRDLKRADNWSLDSGIIAPAPHSTVVGVGMLNLRRRFTFANAAYAQFLDIPQDDIVGRRVSDVFSQIDEAQIPFLVDRAFEGEHVAHELLRRTASGDRFYSISYEPIPENGAVSVVAILVTDVSDRKQAEFVWQKTEERYRTLFDYLPDGILISDSDSVYLDANAAMCAMLGYTISELAGKHASDIIAPDMSNIDKALGAINSRSDYHREWRFRRKDGSMFDAEVVATKMPDGNLLSVVRDITERKQVEEERATLAQLVAHSPDSFTIADLSGRLTFMNAGARRMVGIPEDKDIDEIQFRDYIPPHMYEFFINTVIASARQDGEWLGEMQLQNAQTGELVDVLRSTFVLVDASGHPHSFAHVSRDITERNRTAEKITQLNAELEQRVIERTEVLQSVNKELEAFSYSVSHDLRAPLRHINGFSLALLEDYSDKLDEKGKGFLREVRSASQEMARLIDVILQLAKVARREIRRERVDMTTLANEILHRLKKAEPDREIKLFVEKGLIGYGDRRLLNIALTNLLENAWKFTSKREQPEISFVRDSRSGSAGYSVTDNGSGFDMRYADKLFGAFQRLHSVDEFEGTGIGLATVRRIINRHGGRIWADGKVDSGATFFFTLPEQTEIEHGEQGYSAS